MAHLRLQRFTISLALVVSSTGFALIQSAQISAIVVPAIRIERIRDLDFGTGFLGDGPLSSTPT